MFERGPPTYRSDTLKAVQKGGKTLYFLVQKYALVCYSTDNFRQFKDFLAPLSGPFFPRNVVEEEEEDPLLSWVKGGAGQED